MKRSGFAVTEASRVIEIERGIGGEDRLRLHERAEGGKNPSLDLLVLRGGLDHEIAVCELVERGGVLNAIEDRLTARLVQLPPCDLARQMAVDRRQRRVDPLLRHVVEKNVHAGLGDDLSDAGPHLPRADDPDRLDVQSHDS